MNDFEIYKKSFRTMCKYIRNENAKPKVKEGKVVPDSLQLDSHHKHSFH